MIDALKAGLATTKESLGSMQKAKERALHYYKLQREAKKAEETAKKVTINPKVLKSALSHPSSHGDRGERALLHTDCNYMIVTHSKYLERGSQSKSVLAIHFADDCMKFEVVVSTSTTAQGPQEGRQKE